MSLETLTLTKAYAAGKKILTTHVDVPFGQIEAQHVKDNSNFTQLAADIFGASIYSFDNDGVANYTNSIYNKQFVTGTDTNIHTMAVTSAWTDVHATNVALSITPELEGDFKATFTFHLRSTTTDATNKILIKFRLTDGTTESGVIEKQWVNTANAEYWQESIILSHIFENWTTTSKTVKLQYYIQTITATAVEIHAEATTTTAKTLMMIEKI